VAAALVVGAAVASSRRSRREQEAAERWRLSAADAYGQARLIESIVVRDPPDSPELRRRVADARAAFYALASAAPDLPSRQAASMVSSALDDLEVSLSAADAEPAPTVSEALGRLDQALTVLQPPAHGDRSFA
jgi:hypothetical protein